MEQKKRKIIWLTVLLVILILLVVLIWWLLRGSNPLNQPEEDVPIYNTPSANLNYTAPKADEVNPTEFGVVALARMYAERFGSWSTDNQLKNLQELSQFSSPSMLNYLGQQEIRPAQEFYGISTKALSTRVTSQSESAAEVIVSTQRTENKAGQESVFYQDVRLTLVNVGDLWLVSGAYWQ